MDDAAARRGPRPTRREIDRTALALSDIVTFHAYWSDRARGGLIDHLAVHRPADDLHRMDGARLAAGSRTSCACSGTAASGASSGASCKGRTQTYLPWPDGAGARAMAAIADRGLWFHDLLHEDGQPLTTRDRSCADRIRGVATSTVAGSRGKQAIRKRRGR